MARRDASPDFIEALADPPPAALTANRAGGETPLGRTGVRPADIRTSKRL